MLFRSWNPYSAKYLDGKLIVLDKNNLTKSGIRVIRELTNLPSWSNDIVLDKNNNLWMISVESGINKLLCVDTDTEKVIHEINLPVSYFSTLRTAAYDIDNDGKYLYLRSHKAFFIIDVDSPSIPDEAHGEIRELVGELYDIKVSADGTILVIDQGQGNFVTSSIVEFKQDGTGNKWQELSRQTIGYQATKIYVPNYVKRY